MAVGTRLLLERGLVVVGMEGLLGVDRCVVVGGVRPSLREWGPLGAPLVECLEPLWDLKERSGLASALTDIMLERSYLGAWHPQIHLVCLAVSLMDETVAVDRLDDLVCESTVSGVMEWLQLQLWAWGEVLVRVDMSFDGVRIVFTEAPLEIFEVVERD